VKRISYIIIVTVFLFAGCNYLKYLSFKKPEIITIKNLKLDKISLTDSLELSMSILFDNRNNIDINVINSEYDVYINDKYLGKGKLILPQTLVKDNVTEMKGKIKTNSIEFLKCGVNIITSVLTDESVLYKVKGELEINVKEINISMKVPFELKSNLSLSIQ
jgi:LEA14-like dessication related protein